MGVLILVMCGIGYRALKVTGAAVDVILEEEVTIADATMEAIISLREAQDSATEFILTTDTAQWSALEQEFQAACQDFDKFITAIVDGGDLDGETVIATDNEALRQLAKDADTEHEKFEAAAAAMFAAQRAGDKVEVRQHMEGIDAAVTAAAAALEQAEVAAGEEMNTAMLGSAQQHGDAAGYLRHRGRACHWHLHCSDPRHRAADGQGQLPARRCRRWWRRSVQGAGYRQQG
jgi:hypothetical protein